MSYASVIGADSPVTSGECDGGGVTPGATQDGETGTAFNGSSVYVTSAGTDDALAFSVEFWYKLPTGATSANSGYLVANNFNLVGGFNNHTGFQITEHNGGVVAVFGMGGVSPDNASITTQPHLLQPNLWNHVVVTLGLQTITIYINGVIAGTASLPHPYAKAVYSTFNGVILWGAGPSYSVSTGLVVTPNAFVTGDICQAAVYHSCLTLPQVIAHYNGSTVNTAPSVTANYYYPAIMADSPVGYYRADDSAGVQALDVSGNGNNGCYLPLTTLNKPGATSDGDDAVQFDGVWGALATPIVRPSTMLQFSIECWFYALDAAPGGHEVVFAMGDIGNLPPVTSVWLSPNGSTHVNVNFAVSATPAFPIQHQSTGSATLITTNAWHYVVLTFDGGVGRLYLDGQLVSTGNDISAYTPVAANTKLVFGNSPNNPFNWQAFNGVWDEGAFYNGVLTPTQINNHYLAAFGPPPPPPTFYVAGTDEHYWAIQVWDSTGSKLLDLPQADIESLQITDVINGGSSTGTITFQRDFNKIGQIQYLNRVLIWFWHGKIARPLNPYWAGYMVDIDQEKTRSLGKITVNIEGDQNQVDRGVVSENINPYVNGNPSLDAADYCRHLWATYSPPNFASFTCPPALFPLLPNQFQQQKLGSVIDTVLKTGRDNVGRLVTWRVHSDYTLRRDMLIQSDQNPNSVGGITFRHIFADEMCAQYSVSTKYREITNVITVLGGNDAITGLQVTGAYVDDNSVAAFGPWEDILSVPSLISSDSCSAYAEAYLDLHSNPQAQGEIVLLKPDPSIQAGTWIQVWENASVIKQMRVSSVTVELGRTFVKQTLEPTAPTPYLDYAVYRTGLNAANNASRLVTPLPVNTQQNYVRSGGTGSI